MLYLCLTIRSFYFFYIFTSKRENMSEIDLICLFLMIEGYGKSLIPNPTYICKNRHTSFHRIIFFSPSLNHRIITIGIHLNDEFDSIVFSRPTWYGHWTGGLKTHDLFVQFSILYIPMRKGEKKYFPGDPLFFSYYPALDVPFHDWCCLWFRGA